MITVDTEMDIDIRHRPSFAVARVRLAPGEELSAESGAMMATSAQVTVEASSGGMLSGLKRSVLGGESMYVSRFRADNHGWVDVAARLPGDLVVVEVGTDADGADGTDGADGVVNLARGSWLASSEGITLDTVWGGMKNLLGGEGGFLVRAEGRGRVIASCYGAIDVLDLAADERLVLDTGHLVAFDDRLTFTTRDVSTSLMQSLKSGERLVFEFTGPGRLWTQSRNPKELVGWLAGKLPFKRK